MHKLLNSFNKCHWKKDQTRPLRAIKFHAKANLRANTALAIRNCINLIAQTVPLQRRLNFQEADRKKFATHLHKAIFELYPMPAKYVQFVW